MKDLLEISCGLDVHKEMETFVVKVQVLGYEFYFRSKVLISKIWKPKKVFECQAFLKMSQKI